MPLPEELSDLTWTTREQVAARLAHFLSTTPSAPALAPDPGQDPKPSPRARAAELLRILKSPAQEDCLRSLLLNREEEIEARWEAAYGLERIHAELTGEELAYLFSDEKLVVQDESHWAGPQDLLTLARSADAQVVALHYLIRLTPEERTHLLTAARIVTPAPLLDWMFERWLTSDRHLVAVTDPHPITADCGIISVNASVVAQYIDRTETRAVLQELWREATGLERRQLAEKLVWDDVERSFPDDLTAEETSELAESLALPSATLAAFWGRERLFQVLDGCLIAEHERQVALHQHHKLIEDESRLLVPTLRVLCNWEDPAVDDWIAERYVDQKLHWGMRWELTPTLQKRNRTRFSQAVLQILEIGAYRMSRHSLRWAYLGPVESDRPAFWKAARASHSAELQYYALCGLEQLGESGAEWEARLTGWTQHPEPRLRIRALGALARRGDLQAREVLLAWAEGPHPLPERAEVISTLGELDAAANLPLLTRVLAHEEQPEEGPFRDYAAPAAEEAALALARFGSPEALTALVRSYLSTGARYLHGGLNDYLTAIVDAEPGVPPDLALPTLNWHSVVHTRWND